VRITTWATYSKQLKLVEDRLGEFPVRQLRPEEVTTFVSELVDCGSAASARNVRTLLVHVLDQAVTLGLTTDTVARKVCPPRVPRVERRTLTPAEGSRLLAACDDRIAHDVGMTRRKLRVSARFGST
jgi:hypothetical protein